MRLCKLAVLGVAVIVAACDGTSPAPTLDGVWAARANVYAETDSLILALGQDGSEVRGFATVRRFDDPGGFVEPYAVQGSLTGQSVELLLLSVFPPGARQPLFRGTLRGGELAGTFTTFDGDKAVVLRLSDPRGGGVAGTYALASTSGLPTGQTWAIRDTIVALSDGRARRHREESAGSYEILGTWSRRGDWMMLEQFSYSGIPFRDSLRIQSSVLLRTTEQIDGSMVVERYERAP